MVELEASNEYLQKFILNFEQLNLVAKDSKILIKTTWSETPSVKDYNVVIFWQEVIIWVTKRKPIDKANKYEVTQAIISQIF